jgi:uncharacterized heparinase superfamily protein
MTNWIDENPPGTENSWDPFPISLRLVNWIKYFYSADVSDKGCARILLSAYTQARWLESSIEYHLLANHFFKNAKALIFAGLFFRGDEPDKWLKKGVRILKQEIKEQILSDGGHFERSPMYHSMILEDVLDLINLCQQNASPILAELGEELIPVSGRMIRFLANMTHPDGQIALFNDAAFNIELPPVSLFEYYSAVTGSEVTVKNDQIIGFPATGYFILAPGSYNRMLIDCGVVGPDYQPGHSHCDMLSFELTLRGQRIIVDSGCFQYQDGEIRQYNRGNAGHNSLTVDSANQSEVWSAHRCAKRARPIYARARRRPSGDLLFEGAHDGYKRLNGNPIHHRRIQWLNKEIWIEDQVNGQGRHGIELRLHVHPDLTASFDLPVVEIRHQDKMVMTVSTIGPGPINIENGWYCPEFGIKYACPVLVVKFDRVKLPFTSGWIFKLT